MVTKLLAVLGQWLTDFLIKWFSGPKTQVENIHNAIDEAIPAPSIDTIVSKYERVLPP